jgi:cupin 2 domain-containing protein
MHVFVPDCVTLWASRRSVLKAKRHLKPTNLLANLPARPEPTEIFETLLTQPGVRIERIISTGQASPAGFWYDQAQAEWVLLVQGAAVLKFEDEQVQGEIRQEVVKTLAPGDHLYIAPHRRHRVEFTQADPPTVWLAIHMADDANCAGTA